MVLSNVGWIRVILKMVCGKQVHARIPTVTLDMVFAIKVHAKVVLMEGLRHVWDSGSKLGQERGK